MNSMVKSAIVSLLVALLALAPVQPAYATTLTRRAEGMRKLLPMSEDLLQKTLAICNKPDVRDFAEAQDCRDTATGLLQHAKKGRAFLQDPTSDSAGVWLQEHAEGYQRLQKNLEALQLRLNPAVDPTLFEHARPRACLRTVAKEVTCADMLGVATAICSLYLAVSPLAGVICEVASIYGYIGCIY
ncbi:MAG TPA: hypothetical protein VMA75_01345 [Candidatus Paceibacterota bacterium]|nr:hypothetical protein [Candidatus Paceibacterota bacterium]